MIYFEKDVEWPVFVLSDDYEILILENATKFNIEVEPWIITDQKWPMMDVAGRILQVHIETKYFRIFKVKIPFGFRTITAFTTDENNSGLIRELIENGRLDNNTKNLFNSKADLIKHLQRIAEQKSTPNH